LHGVESGCQPISFCCEESLHQVIDALTDYHYKNQKIWYVMVDNPYDPSLVKLVRHKNTNHYFKFVDLLQMIERFKIRDKIDDD
jgi:hypothetical protein